MKLLPCAMSLFLAVLLMGCVSDGQQQVQKPPKGIPPELRNQIDQGETAVGMTKEQVGAVLENSYGIKNLRKDCWVYTDLTILGMDEVAETQVILTFENNVVVDRSVRILHKTRY